MSLPLIAITMGDPAGIGPEITVKVLSRIDIYKTCRPLVIGAVNVLADAMRFTHRALQINVVDSPQEGQYSFGTIDVIDMNNIDIEKLEYGKVSAMCGKAAGEYIAKAIELAMAGLVDAVATNPINKESFVLGGWGKMYPGHTEMFADLTKTERYSMMLQHENFRVVHVSTHVSLVEACRRVKKDRVLDTIRIANAACKAIGIDQPKVGVAGLNPHAGDGELFGREDIDEIQPAVLAAREEGIDASGPIPADTIFSRARGGWYDIVVAMYHDQGHIPLKLTGFVWDESSKSWESISGVNVTLGLPIIRTSVDHGTAFGKAGKGTARADSLYEAIYMATRFAVTRAKTQGLSVK